MLKRHCDICDGVIGPTSQYRTIHFGRGNNEDIDIGVEPQCICKNCWKTMITSVKPEAYIDNIEPLIKKAQTDDIVSTIVESVLPDGAIKRCRNCKYSDRALYNSDDICDSCSGFDKWEASNG